jgi:preprotein translocase subunit YajC
MGIIATAAPAATSSGGSSTFLILIVVVFIGFYFLLIRPQRNRQRKVMQQQNTVLPGARVRTTAGMYATVVVVDGDDVVLEVAPGVEARYLKKAIMEVLSEGVDAPAEDFADETEEPEDEAEEPADATAEHDGDVTEPKHGAESDPEVTVYHPSGNGESGSVKPESSASKE